MVSLLTMNHSKKQDEEVSLVNRLLRCCGHIEANPIGGDRPDIIVTIDNRKIGVEVTQFHSDEGHMQTSIGSHARALEVKLSKLASGRPYSVWGNPDPNPGIIARITDKIARAETYDTTNYSELWLLVATGIPRLGAVGSTFAFPDFVSIKRLNDSTDAILVTSNFARVYIHMHLPIALFS